VGQASSLSHYSFQSGSKRHQINMPGNQVKRVGIQRSAWLAGSLALSWVGGAFAADDSFAPGARLGVWAGADIAESSGIAQSQSGQDVFWTHGDNAENWLAGARRDGTHLGRLHLNCPPGGDTEDMATGPGPVAGENYIYYGNIGDNEGKRSAGIQVYRLIEPAFNGRFGSLTVDCDRLLFQYPDGPRDCETLMVDPRTKDLYFVSKRDHPVRLYVARYPQLTNTTTTLEKLGDLPASIGTWITAGDISADGSEIILRNDVKPPSALHNRVFYWNRNPGEDVYQAMSREPSQIVLSLPQPQGEAICWAKDGAGFYTSSEGRMRLDWYPRLSPRPPPTLPPPARRADPGAIEPPTPPAKLDAPPNNVLPLPSSPKK